jgi:DNA-binding CsgD family transcriptional regulator/PAS domain-containing protein
MIPGRMDDVLLPLIAGCYDTALDPGKWSDFLRRLAVALTVRHPSIFLRTPEPDHPGHFFTAVETPISLRWGELSKLFAPFLERALLPEPLEYHEFSEQVSDEELVASEFYHRVLQPLDLHHGCGAMLLRDEDGASSIVMWRSRAEGPLPAPGRRLFEALLPHLQRAVQVHLRLHGAIGVAKGITDALDELAQGALLIDRRGRPIFWNRSADELLREGDGLVIERETLRASCDAPAAALSRAIDEATRTGAGEGIGAGGKVAVDRPSGAPAVSVLVSPLARGVATASLAENACALVLISSPPRDPLPTAKELSQRWRLTPAEARTVLHLASGLPVDRIALEMKLRPATIRTYLKRAYEKTGADGQASLVSLVLRPR